MAGVGRLPPSKPVDAAGEKGTEQPPVVAEDVADEDEQPGVPGQRLVEVFENSSDLHFFEIRNVVGDVKERHNQNVMMTTWRTRPRMHVK